MKLEIKGGDLCDVVLYDFVFLIKQFIGMHFDTKQFSLNNLFNTSYAMMVFAWEPGLESWVSTSPQSHFRRPQLQQRTLCVCVAPSNNQFSPILLKLQVLQYFECRGFSPDTLRWWWGCSRATCVSCGTTDEWGGDGVESTAIRWWRRGRRW